MERCKCRAWGGDGQHNRLYHRRQPLPASNLNLEAAEIFILYLYLGILTVRYLFIRTDRDERTPDESRVNETSNETGGTGDLLQHRLIAAGPSGVTQALCARWHETGEVQPLAALPPIRAADGPVLVIAGSLSPVTRQQIEAATTFARVAIDAALLARGGAEYRAKLIGDVLERMAAGQSVIAHTSPLGDEPRDDSVPGIEIARATGQFVASLLPLTAARRIGVAGGDTSSWILRELDVWGLSFLGHLAPGVALCRAHSGEPSLDGLQIMLKGGQMGSPDLFLRLRDGA